MLMYQTAVHGFITAALAHYTSKTANIRNKGNITRHYVDTYGRYTAVSYFNFLIFAVCICDSAVNKPIRTLINNMGDYVVHDNQQGKMLYRVAPKSKPLPNDQKIV